MAVKIPEIKRMGPVDPASVGRIEGRVPDSTGAFKQSSAALTQLGGEVIQQIDRYEAQEADTEATKRDATFQLWATEEMGRIKQQEGDPTELYNKFDQDVSAKLSELMDDGSLSERTRTAIAKKLTNTANHVQLQRLTQAGAQKAIYDEKVNNAGLELKKNALIEATTVLDPNDPTSTAPFDDLIGNMRELVLKHGIKVGTVTPDEAGEAFYLDDDGNPVRVKMNDSAKYRLAKELSEGVYNAMDNLVKAGQIDKANFLKEKYGNYLDPVKRKALADDFEKNQIENIAYQAADAKDMNAVLEQIKDPVQRSKARDKAETIRSDRMSRRERTAEIASKANYNKIMKHIQTTMRENPDAYIGKSELEADPIFKGHFNKVTDAKQQKAIYDAVLAPKETTQAAQVKLQKLFFGDDPDYDLDTIDPDTFYAEYLPGASKADRKRYTKMFEAAKSETGSERNQRMKEAGKLLQDHLLRVGYIKMNEFNRLEGKNAQKFIEARSDMLDHLEKTGNMDIASLDKYIRGYAATRKEGVPFQPPVQPKLPGVKEVKEAAKPPPSIRGGKTLTQWANEYKAEFGRMPGVKNGELENYIKRKQKE